MHHVHDLASGIAPGARTTPPNLLYSPIYFAPVAGQQFTGAGLNPGQLCYFTPLADFGRLETPKSSYHLKCAS